MAVPVLNLLPYLPAGSYMYLVTYHVPSLGSYMYLVSYACNSTGNVGHVPYLGTIIYGTALGKYF